MKPMKALLIILAVSFSSTNLQSCGDSDDAVRAVIDEFVEAMYKPVNFSKMKELYRDFAFTNVVRADAHEIKSLSKENGAVIANIHSHFEKNDGTKVENEFLLKLEEQGDTWKIVNSKGLSRASSAEPSAYDYGVQNGLIKDAENMWDVELLEAVKNAKTEMRKQ